MRGTPDFLDKHMSAPTQPSSLQQQSAPTPAMVRNRSTELVYEICSTLAVMTCLHILSSLCPRRPGRRASRRNLSACALLSVHRRQRWLASAPTSARRKYRTSAMARSFARIAKRWRRETKRIPRRVVLKIAIARPRWDSLSNASIKNAGGWGRRLKRVKLHRVPLPR